MPNDLDPAEATRLVIAGGGGLAPGTLLCNGTYRIEERLGAGGMGEVYRGLNTVTGSSCAIKTIRVEHVEDEFLRGLFAREAEALKSIRDSAVVGYEGVFRDESGRLLIVMEHVDGPSLGERMRRQPLTVEETTRLARRLGHGLAAAHARGVHHRDLSPDNVLLPGGRLEDAVLIDFGIARREGGQGPTLFGREGRGFAGKLAYASPEQIGAVDAPLDHRSDIYSLGLVLAAAARGRPLPMGEDMLSAMAARRQAPDLASLPEALRGLLAPLLTPEPGSRLQSLEGFPKVAAPAAAVTAPASRRRSGWLPWAGAGVVGLALAAAGYVLLSEPPPVATPTPPVGTDLAGPAKPAQQAAPPQAAAGSDRVAIESALASAVAASPCGEVGAVLDDGLVAHLSGTLPSEAARDELVARAGAIPGVARVDGALSVQPAPHCEAVEAIVALAGAPGLPLPVIALSRPDGVYRADRDVFEATLSLPDGPAAFVYLDYFDVSGEVYHLLPETMAPANALSPGAEIHVGRPAAQAGPRDRVWRLSEPFGPGRVLAIVSAQPLYEGLRPIGEHAADYVDFLRGVLPALGSAGLSTAWAPIETRAGS